MIKVKNRHIKCLSKTFYWIHYPEWLRKSKYIQSIQHAHPWKILEVAMFQHKCLYFMLNSLLQWDSVNFLMLIKACCCYLNKDVVWIRYTVCKISRNHGWSKGPMVTFLTKGPINNIPALVQIMAWCRPGDKPLSEQMMVSLLMHICVTRPQWVNRTYGSHC